ncbi:hypothetical protein [Deinococcus cellulosilyticus]|uniref:Uncharacterized protein n=1 Tax=Deinococcus cellulosilyticus (strain DSM 18568 / NBRC 106333 / KACC 11606 / 5516J-15) TaxID=1223518 RepID=A0A511NA84_DEIC1|nr:hypothetical protein [Deinococcus cellulosilyticus]GEM49742.1 hypothetical protein DC3_53770 [Deinococcus cellulosilyticus NBRC 106333 = KACC 11606]
MKSLSFKTVLISVLLSGAASAATVDELLQDLKSPEEGQRLTALDELADYGQEGLTEKEGLKILEAAKLTYGPAGDYSVNAQLLADLRKDPKPSYIKPIVGMFADLDIDAKWYALDILTRFKDNKDALKTYVGLVGKHSAALDSLPVRYLKDQTEYVNVFFPELFKYTRNPALQFDIYDLALSFLYDEKMSQKVLRDNEKQILNDYQALSVKLKPVQQPTGTDWRYNRPYRTDRYFGGLMLDLIGFLNTPAANTVLKDALKYSDPHLKGWAAISLIFNKQTVPAADIQAVADSNDMRFTFYDYLERADRLDLFPEQYRNQQSLAQSDLAHWLTYPDELGYEPASVEYVQTFSEEGKDGKMNYYLFKFTDRDGKAYAGLSGPFYQAEEPTIQGGGSTFSNYTEWDKLSPAGHYEDIMKAVNGEGEA